MEAVKYRDIPVYLREGEFFRSLAREDPESIVDIPFHVDADHTANIKEFCNLLETMSFWMLDKVPLGILDFCDRNEASTWVSEIFRFPESVQSTLFAGLVTAYSTKNLGDFTDFINTSRWEVITHVFSKLKKDSVATAAAARAGNLRLVIHLHQEGFLWHPTTCTNAAYMGHLEVLRYAHSYGCPWDSQVYDAAAQGDHVECMQYAHQQGLQWSARTCSIATQFGSLKCLQYAHEQECEWGRDAVTIAVQSGNVECLQYLLENNCPFVNWICDTACKFNQPVCLALLLDHNASFGVSTSYLAAKCPDSACLECLHHNGCPWDRITVRYALTYGSVANLSFAMERHCPYDDNLLVRAVVGQSFSCLQYLIEVQVMTYTSRTLFAALLSGNLEHLQYLVDQGCPITDPAAIGEDATEIYDQYFVPNNPEFQKCVVYAVERGLFAADHFIHYVMARDIKNCARLCVEQGWLSYTSTGEGFLNFIRNLFGEEDNPLARLLQGKDSRCIDKLFTTDWDKKFLVDNVQFVLAVRTALWLGWIPDAPIRHFTGITMTRIYTVRTLAAIQTWIIFAVIVVFNLLKFLWRGLRETMLTLQEHEFFIWGRFDSPFAIIGSLVWFVMLLPKIIQRIRYPRGHPLYPKVKYD